MPVMFRIHTVWQSPAGDPMYLTLNCLQVLHHLSQPGTPLLPGIQNSVLLLSSVPYSDDLSVSLSPAVRVRIHRHDGQCTSRFSMGLRTQRLSLNKASILIDSFSVAVFLFQRQLKKAFKHVLSRKCSRSL